MSKESEYTAAHELHREAENFLRSLKEARSYADSSFNKLPVGPGPLFTAGLDYLAALDKAISRAAKAEEAASKVAAAAFKAQVQAQAQEG